MRLHVPDIGDHPRCHIRERDRRLSKRDLVEHIHVEHVHRLLIAERFCERVEHEQFSASARGEEERRKASVALHRDDGRHLARGALAQTSGERADRRRLKKRRRAKCDPVRALNLGEQADRLQRMPSEEEEIVVGSDRPLTEDVLPDRLQAPFDGVGERHRVAAIHSLQIRHRQRAPVEFSAYGQR